MTYAYEPPMWPNLVEVKCPKCEQKADFFGSKQIVKEKNNHGQPSTKIFTDKRRGKLSCLACVLVKQHVIEWPRDAYFSFSVRNKVLWAWNRQHAIDIRDYLSSTDRVEKNYNHAESLYLIPEVFKTAKNRSKCVEAINKSLGMKNNA